MQLRPDLGAGTYGRFPGFGAANPGRVNPVNTFPWRSADSSGIPGSKTVSGRASLAGVFTAPATSGKSMAGGFIFDFVGSIKRRRTQANVLDLVACPSAFGCGSRSRQKAQQEATVAPQKPLLRPARARLGKNSGQEDGPACR